MAKALRRRAADVKPDGSEPLIQRTSVKQEL